MGITRIVDFIDRDPEILKSYKEDRTDWCHHELAVECVSKRFDISKEHVRSVVRRLFDINSIL